MQPHLGLPLPDKPFGRHHQDPLRHAAQLELAQNEPGFDRLAEPHLVGEQISDPVPAHGPIERIELVRQRARRSIGWAPAGGFLPSASSSFAAAAVCRMCSTVGWTELRDARSAARARTMASFSGQPDPIGGFAPNLLRIDDTAGRGMSLMPAPCTDIMCAAPMRHASASMRVTAWSYQSSSFSSSCSATSGIFCAMPDDGLVVPGRPGSLEAGAQHL